MKTQLKNKLKKFLYKYCVHGRSPFTMWQDVTLNTKRKDSSYYALNSIKTQCDMKQAPLSQIWIVNFNIQTSICFSGNDCSYLPNSIAQKNGCIWTRMACSQFKILLLPGVTKVINYMSLKMKVEVTFYKGTAPLTKRDFEKIKYNWFMT